MNFKTFLFQVFECKTQNTRSIFKHEFLLFWFNLNKMNNIASSYLINMYEKDNLGWAVRGHLVAVNIITIYPM